MAQLRLHVLLEMGLKRPEIFIAPASLKTCICTDFVQLAKSAILLLTGQNGSRKAVSV